MKISYLVTCSTETKTLTSLLKTLAKVTKDNDEIVVVMDEKHANEKNETYNIVAAFHHSHGCYITTHPLNNDYGAHKNFGNSKCTGDWIFQIDGDELPPESLLGDNLRAIINGNPDVELIRVPRINDQRGVTEEDAKEFGWRLIYLSEYENGKVPLISWPDYQSRIYKNVPDRIKWVNKLHEIIHGHNQYSILPSELDYALYHDKSIDTARKTNRKYKEVFQT